MNDIVQARPDPPQVDDGVYDSLELYGSSESYDEYILRCTCIGVELLFYAHGVRGQEPYAVF